MNLSETNEDFIEVSKRCFFETNNPMYVWEALRFARVVNAPLPDWVMSYLDLTSQRLFAIAADLDREKKSSPRRAKKPKDIAQRIAAAFLLTKSRVQGGGSHFSNYHHNWKDLGMEVRHRVHSRCRCMSRTSARRITARQDARLKLHSAV